MDAKGREGEKGPLRGGKPLLGGFVAFLAFFAVNQLLG